MTTRSPVVIAQPTGGARWRVEMPGRLQLTTRTLATARTAIARRIGAGFDLQVRLGGLEDLCADAVDLGQRSDQSMIEAIRLRRQVAIALTEAGLRRTDVAYLMSIPPDTVAHLLTVPIDSPWMTAGHSPPTPFPRVPPAVKDVGLRRFAVVLATRDGTGWQVHLNAGCRSTRRSSLVHADKLARDLAGDIDVLLCPQLPDELDEMIRALDLATADAGDLQVEAYGLRVELARRLRILGVGFADIGELLAIHVHRVRLLLT
jgi:hypothetical protein